MLYLNWLRGSESNSQHAHLQYQIQMNHFNGPMVGWGPQPIPANRLTREGYRSPVRRSIHTHIYANGELIVNSWPHPPWTEGGNTVQEDRVLNQQTSDLEHLSLSDSMSVTIITNTFLSLNASQSVELAPLVGHGDMTAGAGQTGGNFQGSSDDVTTAPLFIYVIWWCWLNS